MAAPNIVGITTVTGITTFVSLGDTNETLLLTNAASSGKVFKVNNIIVANDDGSSSADITISIRDQDSIAGTRYKIAHTVAVAADSTLIVTDKASAIYLEEDRCLTAEASNGGDLDVVCSYEEISS